MPYDIRNTGTSEKPFCVHNSNTGEKMGCSSTEDDAKRHQAALYAAESKDMNHQKAAVKRENGIDFPAKDFAFVPDPTRPSTWKLRLTESPGKVTVAQLGRAAAALSSGGFRGNRVEIPASAVSSVKRRIRAEYRKLGVDESEIPSSVKGIDSEEKDIMDNEFMVWKDINGDYRWMAIYSNNYRDEDNPPEIISEKSHLNFVKMVDEGIVDYPELWAWHTPLPWGKADMVDYVDGFAVASGYVFPDESSLKVAKNMAKAKDIKVSHGMPDETIARDPSDSSVIVHHETVEISPLPAERAANKLTGFAILRGVKEMPLSQEKRKWLIDMGYDEDVLKQLESSAKQMRDVAEASNIESKEGEEAPVTDAPSEEPVTDGEQPASTEETTDSQDKEETPEYTTKEEVAGVIGELISTFSEKMGALTKQVEEQGKIIAQLQKSDEERLRELKESTPSASLSSLIAQNVIGQKEAEVEEDSPLNKDAPKEKAAHEFQFTQSGFLDNLINGAGRNS